MKTELILGVHIPQWLTIQDRPTLMVSITRMPKYKQIIANAPWVLDSGGFTELAIHGGWRSTAKQHADNVRRISTSSTNMRWASPQDWMCEPSMLKKTGKTVQEHQTLTINNFIELRQLAADLPIIPVLQGWVQADYHRHADQYAARGINLETEPIVGVGSVCRRQGTIEATQIFRTLADRGLSLHAFGLKMQGLKTSAGIVKSSDSMAWSYSMRKQRLTCGRLNTRTGVPIPSCANCLHAALDWHTRAVNESSNTRIEQLSFFC